MALTPGKLPYPVGTDHVIDGDDAIKALALALDPLIINSVDTISRAAVAGAVCKSPLAIAALTPGLWRIQAGASLSVGTVRDSAVLTVYDMGTGLEIGGSPRGTPVNQPVDQIVTVTSRPVYVPVASGTVNIQVAALPLNAGSVLTMWAYGGGASAWLDCRRIRATP